MYALASHERAKILSEHSCQRKLCSQSLSGLTIWKHSIVHSSHSHYQLLRTDRTFPVLALWEWLEPPIYSCAMKKISAYRCQVSQAFKSFLSSALDYSCLIIFQVHVMTLYPINSVGGQQFWNEHRVNKILKKRTAMRVQVVIALLIFFSSSGLRVFLCVVWHIKYIANGLKALFCFQSHYCADLKKIIIIQKGPEKF